MALNNFLVGEEDKGLPLHVARVLADGVNVDVFVKVAPLQGSAAAVVVAEAVDEVIGRTLGVDVLSAGDGIGHEER